MQRFLFACILLLGLGLAFGLRAAAGSSPVQRDAENALAKGDYGAALGLWQQVAEYEKGNKDTWAAAREKVAECKKHLTDAEIEKYSWKPKVEVAATGPADQRVAHTPPQEGEVRTIGIKELGNFQYDPEKGGGIPADVQRLSGMKVKVWGFMVALNQTENITEFALVPSLTGCCYGQPPTIQHMITVHVPKGVAYTKDAIRVMGTLRVAEKREEGYTIGLFEIDGGTMEKVEVGVSQEVLQGKKQAVVGNSMK